MSDVWAQWTQAFGDDLRYERLRAPGGDLGLHVPAAFARHRVRQLIAGAERPSAAPGALGPPPLELEEVDGYWLIPAAEALAAFLRGDGRTATSAAAAAQQRDATRTALFLSFSLAVSQRAGAAGSWLPRAVPPMAPSEPLTRAQRALWLALAAGRYGEAGRALLSERLSQLVAGLTASEIATERALWAAALDARVPAPAMPRGLPLDSEPAAAIRSGQHLAALRRWCEQVLAEPHGPEDERGIDREIMGLLGALVDEGTAAETPVLRGADGAHLDGAHLDGARPAIPRWDASVGTPLDLLRSDVFDPRPGRARSLALRSCTPLVLALAAELTESCTARALIVLHAHGQEVTVREERPPAAALASVFDAIDARHPPDQRGLWAGVALISVGLALAAPAVAGGVGTLGLICLALIGLGGKRVDEALRRSRRHTRAAESEKGRLRASVVAASKALSEWRNGAAAARQQVGQDRAALTALLSREAFTRR